MTAPSHATTAPRRRSPWRRLLLLLLVVPYVGTLWVSSYASLTPELWGIPFFYWYQFLWIAISAALTIIVYVAERDAPASRAAAGDTSAASTRSRE